MNEKINDKLNEIIDLINNDKKVIRLKKIKDIIYSDEKIKKSLDEYHSFTNIYSSEFAELKNQIINNKYIEEYRNLENDLYFLTLEINIKLNSLIDKKVF